MIHHALQPFDKGTKQHQSMHAGCQVEGVLSKLDAVHDAFRLWITVEPHPAFPIGLLQMGLKITNEAPVGIKAGLRASYQWVTQVGAWCSSAFSCSSTYVLLSSKDAGKTMQ